MTKHGRNSTANPVYSYHERKRDSRESNFGTIEKRMTGDSMQKLNFCSLTNQECINPVVTRDGYIYEKEAVIQYILKQKKSIKSKIKAFELVEQQKKNRAEDEDKSKIDQKLKDFMKCEVITKRSVGKSVKESTKSLHSSEKHLPCFWLPSLAPEAEEHAQKPTSEVVTCPFTGKPLKLSKMIDVKFSTLKNDSKTLLCAATGDVLTTSTPCVVLATTGDVVTLQYVNKIIKVPGENYMKCPFTGKILEEKQIIQLKCGGSWHAAGGDTHTAKMVTPAMLLS